MKKIHEEHAKVKVLRKPKREQTLVVHEPKMGSVEDEDALASGMVIRDQTRIKKLIEESADLPLQDLRPEIEKYQHNSGKQLHVKKGSEGLVLEVK